MAAPHVAGAAALLLQRHPGWTPRAGQVGARLDRRAGLGRHGAHGRGARRARGRRARRTSSPPTIRSCSRARPRSRFGDLNVNGRRVAKSQLLDARPTQAAAPAHGRSRCGRRRNRAGVDARGPAARSRSRRAASCMSPSPRGQPPTRSPARHTASSSCAAATSTRKIPYALLVTRPGLAPRRRRAAPASSRRATRGSGVSRASVYRYPGGRRSARRRATRARRWTRTAPSASTAISVHEPAVNVGVAVIASPRRLAHPPVAARLARRERRPGLRGHASERQQPHARLPARHRRRRPRSSRARRPTTSRSTPAATSSPARSLAGSVRAARMAERRRAAAARADHRPRRGRPADDRAARPRRGRRRRSVLARDRLRRRRSSARPPTTRSPGSRSSRSQAGAGADGAAARRSPLSRRRLPGVEERRLGRRGADAEHRVRARATIRVVDGADGQLARPRGARVRRARRCRSSWSPARNVAVRSVRFLDGPKRDRGRPARRPRALHRRPGARTATPKGRHMLRAFVTDARGRKAEARRVVRVCRMGDA